MKNQLKYIFVYCFIFSSFILFAQDRNVIWVHGFLGNQGSWEVYDDLFATDRQMTGFRMEYSDNFNDKRGILIAAGDLFGDINTVLGADATNPQNIAVCHSMGGLVSREIERQLSIQGQTQRFGGYVTVATPHHGAALASAVLNGNADAYAVNACNELLAGPINIFTVQGYTPSDVCNIFGGFFNPLKAGGNALLQQTLVDMSPNSSKLNQLNTFSATSTMPRIMITGEESSPKHFRLISTFTTMTNDVKDMDDQMFPNVMTTMRGNYVSSRNFNTALSVAFASFSRLKRFGFGYLSSYLNFRATQWQRGVTWMDNSENQWDAMIGCVNTSTVTTTQQIYLAQTCNDNYSYGSTAWQNCILQNCPGNSVNVYNCYQTNTITSTVVVRQPSDAVVCRDNQELAGAATIIRAENVNHFEERNTRFRAGVDMTQPPFNQADEMEDAFLQVWNRTDFFETPIR